MDNASAIVRKLSDQVNLNNSNSLEAISSGLSEGQEIYQINLKLHHHEKETKCCPTD